MHLLGLTSPCRSDLTVKSPPFLPPIPPPQHPALLRLGVFIL